MDRRSFLSLFTMLPVVARSSLACSEGSAPAPLGYRRTNWSRDPYAFGSYSYVAKGSGDRDRVIASAPIAGRVYFAGEALNPKYQSTVHAAHESGLATAEMVIARQHRRVAVIGAGMSGLTAAHALAGQGCDVTVCEARDRIGGRIWTDRGLPTPLDLGASWIHGPDGNPLTDLADRAGLERVVTEDSAVVRVKAGRTSPWSLRPGWLHELEWSVSSGTEAETLNMKELMASYAARGSGYEGEDVTFTNGYDEIFRVLEGGYETLLSTRVTRIAWSDDGVEVGIAEGEPRRFDAVIVTLPLGVLKQDRVAFEPGLSHERRQAISRMGMGTLDKLYLHYEEAFWERGVSWIYTTHTDLPRGRFNVWFNLHKYTGVPVIMALIGGRHARALAGLSDDELVAQARGVLELNYGS